MEMMYLNIRCFGILCFRQSSVREAVICGVYFIYIYICVCVCVCVCVCMYVHADWRIPCVHNDQYSEKRNYALTVKDENMSENQKTVQGKTVKLTEAWNQCNILIVLQHLFVLRGRKMGFSWKAA